MVLFIYSFKGRSAIVWVSTMFDSGTEKLPVNRKKPWAGLRRQNVYTEMTAKTFFVFNVTQNDGHYLFFAWGNNWKQLDEKLV